MTSLSLECPFGSLLRLGDRNPPPLFIFSISIFMSLLHWCIEACGHYRTLAYNILLWSTVVGCGIILFTNVLRL
ncbi:hypothetical protein ARMGADRAFT_294517 [Armillaria gallica]|uniref:Uncharacterized protein n=1 Tax=Armillaria gallica TaxID=47427 RepID=A0A2H3DH78_ARMGA|nr:hypothetical protein ARMGADRAFT_294517 [Armillaria gallica]